MHATLISIYIAKRDDSFCMASAAAAGALVLLEEKQAIPHPYRGLQNQEKSWNEKE
jgi:hypothetical protein